MENKKHCSVCNKPISKSNWVKHINTKSHSSTSFSSTGSVCAILSNSSHRGF